MNPGSAPNGIALGPDGNLWFTDSATILVTLAIGRITPGGAITEFSTGLHPGSLPSGIAAGADGNPWFTDEGGATRAIGRITPGGAITEFSTGLNPGSEPIGIAAGADGNLWFIDPGATTPAIPAIGRVTPGGAITEFSSGLNNGGYPVGIAAGADGNLWFTDDSTTTPAVGRIGAGAPGAVQAPPVLSGPGVAGSPESCGVSQFATWAGVSPSAGLYSFDGYQWLRDGAPIPGASASSYTPASSDVAHQLACQVTVTYPIPFFVSASAMSAAITVQPSPSPSPSQSPPALSALRAKPITTQGRLVDHHCLLLTQVNRRHPHCTRATALKLTYTLNVSASVSVTIERTAPGRLVNGHCNAPTPKNRHHARCTRVSAHTSITRTATAGANTLMLPPRIGQLTLTPGTYTLSVTPATGRPQHTTFQIPD